MVFDLHKIFDLNSRFYIQILNILSLAVVFTILRLNTHSHFSESFYINNFMRSHFNAHFLEPQVTAKSHFYIKDDGVTQSCGLRIMFIQL